MAWTESSASWVEDTENEPVVRRRKRRRRRSKTAQTDAKQAETTDEPAPTEEAGGTEAQGAKEQEAPKAETGSNSPEPSETTSRPRRRKRRRARPKNSPRSDDAEKQDAEKQNEQTDVHLEQEGAGTEVPQVESDDAPNRADANTSTDDNELPESERTEPREERDHRSIPSWEDAVGVIVAKNIESHSKNPRSSRSRGRGRGRS